MLYWLIYILLVVLLYLLTHCLSIFVFYLFDVRRTSQCCVVGCIPPFNLSFSLLLLLCICCSNKLYDLHAVDSSFLNFNLG